MTRARTSIVLVVVAIVAAAAGALLANTFLHSSSPPIVLQSGTLLQPPRSLPTFILKDQDGTRFDNARLHGRWNLFFFGFTNCGDVCPTTLALLAGLERSLRADGKQSVPRVIFISVDYIRDTPEVVKTYVANFDSSFVGVTGAQTEIEELTTALGVPSAVRRLDNGVYAVDHSAVILAVDPEGKLRAIFSPPHTLAALTADCRSLMGST